MGAHYTSIENWSRASNWLTYIWLLALVAGALLHSVPVGAVGIVAMLGAVVCSIVREIRHTRITKQVIAGFAVVAQRGRTHRLTTEYQRYLTAVA
jgi:hypothetical protein